uniref:tRNA(Ile)-lysidine synthase, chloroplastic n=1 Tax=Flintiella sanguinaria TaxID=101926 RepID=A0A1X9PUJ4_9RHOD|nr:tRNA(Ile)-lysidine synthase [Flintiella sanguinaria]
MNQELSIYNFSYVHKMFHNNLENKYFTSYPITILASISGGQDSICLMKLLYDFQYIYKWNITIIHFDHNWRNDSKINVKYYSFTYSKKIYNEELGRIWRYKSLISLAKNLQCHHIATAHTISDRFETLFHNLIRGTGLDGYLIISNKNLYGKKNIQIIRPLYNANRQQLYWFARRLQLPLWTDSTNFDNQRTRNKIRNELLPYIKNQFNTALDKELSLFLSILYKEIEYLQLKTCFFYKILIHPIKCAINKRLLLSLHKCIQNRIIKLFLTKNTHNEISAKYIEVILNEYKNNNKIIYIDNCYGVYIGLKWIYIIRKL